MLPAVENVARLSIKLRVRADLKPRRIVEMRAHELQREDAHANRDQHHREECFHLIAVTITFQPMRFRSRSNIDSDTSGEIKRSSARVSCSTSTFTSLNIRNNSRVSLRL